MVSMESILLRNVLEVEAQGVPLWHRGGFVFQVAQHFSERVKMVARAENWWENVGALSRKRLILNTRRPLRSTPPGTHKHTVCGRRSSEGAAVLGLS